MDHSVCKRCLSRKKPFENDVFVIYWLLKESFEKFLCFTLQIPSKLQLGTLSLKIWCLGAHKTKTEFPKGSFLNRKENYFFYSLQYFDKGESLNKTVKVIESWGFQQINQEEFCWFAHNEMEACKGLDESQSSTLGADKLSEEGTN